jgi:hypothetical protein
MILTRNKKFFLAVMFIIMAVYNVVIFIIPFSRGGGFWTGYSFTMLAMLLTTGVGYFIFDRKGLQSKFYGIPLMSVVLGYLSIQFVIGLLETGMDYIPIAYKYGIALNTVILGACLIGLIAVNMTREAIEHIDEKVKEKVFYIKSLQADAEGFVDRATDESVKKVLKELAETIRYSDPMSSPQLAVIENKIETKVAVLSEIIEKADSSAIKTVSNELQQLLAERNRKCKALKQ